MPQVRRLRHTNYVGLRLQERGGRLQDERVRFLVVHGLHVKFLFLLSLSDGVDEMTDMDSSHLNLQRQIDCHLETNARTALDAWRQAGWVEEPGTDSDEAPLKLIALCILAAVEEKAVRIAMDKDAGITVYGETTFELPEAPSFLIARGLEILREIIGLQGPRGEGVLCLGLRNDSLELIIQKEAGRHIINIPSVRDVS